MRWERLCTRKENGGIGFRHLRGFNLAMVFKAKYFPKGDFLTAKEGSNPSLIWKSIWSSQSTTVRTDDLEDLVVSDLMIPGLLEWDEEHVSMIFNDKDATVILNTPLPRYRSSDKLVWHFSKDGRYTVRSAYRLYMERILNQTHLMAGGNWSVVWALKIPPKVKHFVWRLGRNTISTKEALHHRHVFVNGGCGCCGNFLETSYHLFLDCSVARTCWSKAGLAQVIDASLHNFQGTCAEWLLNIIASNTEEVVHDICMVLWSLWRERNARVWSNKHSTPEWIVQLGKDLLADWKQARSGSSREEGDQRQRPCAKWHPPKLGELKCNVDAAIDGTVRKTGAGMVVRDEVGTIIKYRTVAWDGSWSSKEAEGRALLEAMSWLEMEGFVQVTIESDAKVVVDAIRQPNIDNTEFGDLVQGCLSILARQPGYMIEFVRRERNAVAHELARFSTSTSEPFIGEGTPGWLNVTTLDLCNLDHSLN
ncbi:Putative ribonuclease H protein At1g65750 [Linum perenne]